MLCIADPLPSQARIVFYPRLCYIRYLGDQSILCYFLTIMIKVIATKKPCGVGMGRFFFEKKNQRKIIYPILFPTRLGPAFVTIPFDFLRGGF